MIPLRAKLQKSLISPEPIFQIMDDYFLSVRQIWKIWRWLVENKPSCQAAPKQWIINVVVNSRTKDSFNTKPWRNETPISSTFRKPSHSKSSRRNNLTDIPADSFYYQNKDECSQSSTAQKIDAVMHTSIGRNNEIGSENWIQQKQSNDNHLLFTTELYKNSRAEKTHELFG